MAPIRKGDGTAVAPTEISEVRTGDGSVIYSAIPDSVVLDFETGDLSRWDTVNDLSIDTNRVYQGSYSGKADGSIDPKAETIPDDYAGGVQLSSFEYYWQETSNQEGGGVRLYNSNGLQELGLATNNPQWTIEDSNGIRDVYDGDGYDRWVRFTVTFNWSNNTFDVDFEDLQSGTIYTESGLPLMDGVNIEMVELVDYSGGGGWEDGNDPEMWYDEITLNS